MNDYQFIAPFYDFLLSPFMRAIRRGVLEIAFRLRPKKILDVACGTGDQLRLLSENGFEAVGVDMSESMLRVCRRANPASDCLLQDATAMAFQDQSFDLVMISFALHETGWESAEKILQDIHRVLKPSGHLLVVDYTDFRETPFYVRQSIHLIERMAGHRHFSNFRRYHHKGGVNSLINKSKFQPVASIHRASRSIALQLFISLT
jgi:demethylmenaquinone methyltransferase/2-methoxy-6-polyprenyl-1,4-benzoquinol methylase